MMTPDPNLVSNDPSPMTLLLLRRAGHGCLIGLLTVMIGFGILNSGREDLIHPVPDEAAALPAGIEEPEGTEEGGAPAAVAGPGRSHAPYDPWLLVLAQAVGGRAGSASAGVNLGFGFFYLLFQITMIDLIIMFYVYPLFITGFQHVSHWRFIGPTLANLHALARQHRDRIRPYGAMGLMVFVLFPFWSTGALVGVVVGYLIGLRTWVTFTAVILGDILAVGTWIFAYQRLERFSPTLALLVLITVFALAMLGTFVARLQRAWKKGTEEGTPRVLDSGSELP